MRHNRVARRIPFLRLIFSLGSACLETSIIEQALLFSILIISYPDSPPFIPYKRSELCRVTNVGSNTMDLGAMGSSSCQPDSIIFIISSTATFATLY